MYIAGIKILRFNENISVLNPGISDWNISHCLWNTLYKSERLLTLWLMRSKGLHKFKWNSLFLCPRDLKFEWEVVYRLNPPVKNGRILRRANELETWRDLVRNRLTEILVKRKWICYWEVNSECDGKSEQMIMTGRDWLI